MAIDSCRRYRAKVGDYLVVRLIGYEDNVKFIVQVTRENPLCIKAKDSGPLADLQPEEFMLLEEESFLIQNNDLRDNMLKEHCDAGTPLISGLGSLGVTDDYFYEILPVERPKPN